VQDVVDLLVACVDIERLILKSGLVESCGERSLKDEDDREPRPVAAGQALKNHQDVST
jgi:hypothetical protein